MLLAVCALVSPSAASAEGLEVSEVRTDNFPRLIVRFSASAADGTPIVNLRPEQLLVWENGVAQQQIDLYSLRESSPELWVSLVIDVSGSMNDDGKLSEAKAAAKAFVSRLRPKDRTSIVTFSDRVVLQQQPTGDQALLRRTIDSLQAKGPTRMNDGLARGVAEVLRAREGSRRAVVLLSDGEDTDSETELGVALAPASEAGAPVYTVGVGADARTDILGSIAQATKARFYAAPNASDLDYVFKRISGQLSSHYEAWWPSSTAVPSGSEVQGRLVVDVPGAAPVETAFSYVMPVVLRPRPREEARVGGGLTEAGFGPAGWTLPTWWPLLLAALAALGVYTAFHGLALRLTRTRYQERLARYVYEPAGAASRAAQAKLNPHAKMRPLVLSLARLTHRLLPARMLDELRRRLVLAGRPTSWHFAQFLSTKLILGAGLAIGGYLSVQLGSGNALASITILAALAVLGFYLPHIWLGTQIKARQKAIQKALPDALDLMTVGVGAGLSLDGAILEIVEKSDNPLSRELANFLAELRMGRSRREALQGLQARTEVEDVKVLVASLLQAEELGMSLSDTLVVQADQMRQRRRQRAEEQAHKATIKMLFPMILLIFPALFVVIMGPAVPSLMGFLGHGGV